jgi:hypothetical protein
MRFALIENNVVTQISLAPKSGTGWEAVPDDVYCGFTRADGGSFVQAPQSVSLRRQMAEYWASLPAWLRGPYQHLYSSTAELVSLGDTEAIEALLDSVEPSSAIREDASKLNQFTAAISQLRSLLT